jgi:hypothetical protein
MKKETIAKLFNYAALPLYAANEGLQKLHEAGIPVYDSLPAGGDLVRNYMSGFFGAAAAAFVTKINIRHALPTYQNEIAVGLSRAALTLWEATHINNHFDWGDMGVYVAALSSFYALNRNAAQPTAPSVPKL